jgi:hypothetical protein
VFERVERDIPELVDEILFTPVWSAMAQPSGIGSSLDVGVGDLKVSLIRVNHLEAYLKNLLAGEQVPLLTDFSFDKVVEGLDAEEVDKGVSDLMYQLSTLDLHWPAYITAIGEIESEVHEVELTRDNLDISEYQAGIGFAHFIQDVV